MSRWLQNTLGTIFTTYYSIPYWYGLRCTEFDTKASDPTFEVLDTVILISTLLKLQREDNRNAREKQKIAKIAQQIQQLAWDLSMQYNGSNSYKKNTNSL